MSKRFIVAAVVICLLLSGAMAQKTRRKPNRKPIAPKTRVVPNPSPAPSPLVAPVPVPMPTPIPTPAPPSLDTILNEAEKQTGNYETTFKDLLAIETKTFERYDKNGDEKDPTVIESDFLVYQSPKEANTILELRNVVKVDGKFVSNSQARSEKFLADLQKTTTSQNELEKLAKEGSRYDKTIEVYGYTLFEARVLDDKIRPFFDFQLLGTENYNGREVYVVGYQQNKNSPYITLNDPSNQYSGVGLDYHLDVPKELKNADARISGKLLIDKENYQIWRQDEDLKIQSQEPLTLITTSYVYQQSDYGILVPKEISLLTNTLKKDDSGQFQIFKDTKVSFTYSKFRKTNTDVKILDNE